MDAVVRRSGKRRVPRQIHGEDLADRFAQLLQPLHVRGGKQPVRVRRDVQQQRAVAAHRAQVQIRQLPHGLHLFVFVFVPEPPGADGGVHLRGSPFQRGSAGQQRAAAQVRGRGAQLSRRGFAAGEPELFRDHAPLAGPRYAGLVAAPAHVRPANGNAGLRLEFTHRGVVAVPVVCLFFAVGTLAAGAVEPHAEQVAVVRQQLRQLGAVIVVVGLALPIQRAVAVPGGQVHPEPQPGPFAGLGRFFHHVAFAAPEGGILHAVLRIGAGPQAEAVVVLGGQDQPGHAGGLCRRRPLVRVQLFRVEDRFALRAVAPLLIGKGVHRKMDEGVKLHLLVPQLPL